MNEPLPVVGRGFCFEDLALGARFRTHRRTISEADLSNFVNLTWLTEELFAVADDEGRAIKGRAVPGALVYSFAEGLLLPTMQDTGLAFLNATLDVKRSTAVGDTIHIKGAHTELTETVASMEVEHRKIEVANPGEEFGLQVADRVRTGDRVFKVTP